MRKCIAKHRPWPIFGTLLPEQKWKVNPLFCGFPIPDLFVRVEGPIVELLSQLPFADIDSAVREWRERTGHADSVVQDASHVWHKLCDWGAILDEEIKGQTLDFNSNEPLTISAGVLRSRIARFVDSQEFYGDEEVFHLGA